MARVTAIIPTWNRADLARSILGNLAGQTRRPDEVIVVDNGSGDETVRIARDLGADVIEFSANRGFAAAINAGIARASGDWLLLLNNDVLLAPNWLETVVSSAEAEQAAFAVGKLLRARDPGVIDGTWDLVSRAGYAWRCGYGRPDGAAWSTRRKIAFAPMTAALFRKDVFEHVGLLETRFESYYEDVDFGIRCALAGLEGVYEPAAVGQHMEKSTMGRRAARVMFLSARNQLLLLAKHYPLEVFRRFAWPILAGQVLSLGAAAKQGNFIAAFRGKVDALRRWRTFRDDLPAAAHAEAIFSASEREIGELQRQLGFDIYWRLYFALMRDRL